MGKKVTDYISREAALNLIDRYWQQAFNARFLDAAVRLWSVYREMEDLPAADVRPVVRARWNTVKYPLYECSNCGAVYQDVGYGFNYCHNCGALMEES